MSHKTVTHDRSSSMPRQTGLMRRNGRYYLNLRVPQDLLPLYEGKETIRKSLKTSDYRKAVPSLRLELLKLEAEFAQKRKQRDAGQSMTPVFRVLPPQIEESAARDLVISWFVGEEGRNDEWWANEGRTLDETSKKECLENLDIDEDVLSSESSVYGEDDGSHHLDVFLKAEKINCPKESRAYLRLAELFRQAKLESVLRLRDRFQRRTPAEHNPVFRGVFAHSEVKPHHSFVTVGEMCRRFREALELTKRANVTQRTYALPIRLLEQELGVSTPVTSVTREMMENLFRLFQQMPTNARKRYPGLTLSEAVVAADRDGDPDRLSEKTLENYYNNISTIFNFAVEKGMIPENPARGKWLRAELRGSIEREDALPKALFSMDLSEILCTGRFQVGVVLSD